MLAFREAAPAELRSAYRALWREHKQGLETFSALDAHQDRLTQGGFLLLRRRFQLRTLALFRAGRPIVMATLYRPIPGWPDRSFPASLGAFAAASDLQPEDAAFFWEEIARRYGEEQPVGPLNGHQYLGFGLAPAGADAARVGFQTAAPHRNQEVLFGRFRTRTPYRRHYSFETQVTPELVARLESDLKQAPNGLRVRPFSPWRARRDFAILNELVNASFTHHFDFAPLTEEENWDIFRFSVPLLSPQHLLFLEDRGRPVGFCLGMRDYNRRLGNVADWKNVARLAMSRRTQRGRLIHIGILPEYRGQGLVKQARHRILLAFAREGMQTVENSYVDEGNANSLGNVRSTGAAPLHTFTLERFGAM